MILLINLQMLKFYQLSHFGRQNSKRVPKICSPCCIHSLPVIHSSTNLSAAMERYCSVNWGPKSVDLKIGRWSGRAWPNHIIPLNLSLEVKGIRPKVWRHERTFHKGILSESDSLWPMKWGGSDTMPILGKDLKRCSIFVFCSWQSSTMNEVLLLFPEEVHGHYPQKERGHLEEHKDTRHMSEASVDLLPMSATTWIQLSKWPQPVPPRAELPSWTLPQPLTHINWHCFEVICSLAIHKQMSNSEKVLKKYLINRAWWIAFMKLWLIETSNMFSLNYFFFYWKEATETLLLLKVLLNWIGLLLSLKEWGRLSYFDYVVLQGHCSDEIQIPFHPQMRGFHSRQLPKWPSVGLTSASDLCAVPSYILPRLVCGNNNI